MAILKCFSVFDKAVGAFGRPFYTASRGEAMRVFMDAVNEDKSPFNKHPEDFLLFDVGEFEEGTGIFSSREPEKVISALECIRKEPGTSIVPLKGNYKLPSGT